MSTRGKILAHVGFEALGSADKRAIVLVPKKIVKNALTANAVSRADEVKTGIEELDVGPRGQIRHIESRNGKQFVQVPGATSKDSIGLALNPLLDLGFGNLMKCRLVDTDFQ